MTQRVAHWLTALALALALTAGAAPPAAQTCAPSNCTGGSG